MPHHPEDRRYRHLPLIRVDVNPDRRKRPGLPGGPPNRGGRTVFASRLFRQIDELEHAASQGPVTRGFSPHLVFRVPLAAGAPVETVAQRLRDTGLIVVAIEPDKAIVVFQDDSNLAEFREALSQYEQGPRLKRSGARAKTTKWDVFEFIEADKMRTWSREDRIGKHLMRDIGEAGERIDTDKLYIVDVELWHPGLLDAARNLLSELETIVGDRPRNGERVRDTFAGDLLVLARVAVFGAKLGSLLDMPVIAEIEKPEQPTFDAVAVTRATPRQFPVPPVPPEDGPRVCILDSGIVSSHPLLASNVGHEAAVLTQTSTPADTHGHGTRVGGLAVFGDIRACYTNGTFSSPVRLFSARVLNDQNEFDDEKLIVNQMEQAITSFVRPPHNCRVFNLSLGSSDSVLTDGNSRQSLWAESLDTLIKKHKILLVVSAGNNRRVRANTAKEAEEILANYPRFLFEPACALSDPATAAIALTVGAISEYSAPATRTGPRSNDLARAVAGVNEPSPFTRVGPGINGAIKPDLVDYGGNLLFEGVGSSHRIIRIDSPDPGMAVMSLAHRPLETLFSYGVGTSYAAPRISRLAALAWRRLEDGQMWILI